jgi:hypothetical protein
MPLAEAAALTELTEIQVQRAWDDILRKKHTTDYLRMQPITILSEFG